MDIKINDTDDYELISAKRNDLIVTYFRQYWDSSVGISESKKDIEKILNANVQDFYNGVIKALVRVDILIELNDGTYQITQKGLQYSFVKVLSENRNAEELEKELKYSTIRSNYSNLETIKTAKKANVISIVSAVFAAIAIIISILR